MTAVSSPPTSRGEPEQLRTRHRSGPRSAREWEAVLATSHVAFDVGFTHRASDGFQGTVLLRRLGELMLADCVCTPFRGHRGRAVMGERDSELIGFQTVRRGAERVRSASAEATVTPGQVLLWDGSHPVDVEVVEPFMKRTLIFPRDRVLAVCPRLADVAAFHALGDTPGGRLLARYLDVLADELPTLDEAATAAAADAALELLRAAVEPGMPETRAARRDALRAQVRRYVRRHLQDPRLGPEAIARAHAMSVRTLHALFEGTGESVAALVRRSRLARCLEDLKQPAAGSVTEIAFRWGFSDAAYFSHAFKREYGITPREVRHAALAGQVQRG